jgi:hypothetical protein
MFAWLSKFFAAIKPEIPSPPFKASKKVGTIMYGVWHGRLSPEEARKMARDWGWPEVNIEQMIAEATRPPSYWSRQPKREE